MIDSNTALPIFSKIQQKRDFKPNALSVLRNAVADLGWVQEAAIVEPINYHEKWKLVYSDENSGICQESILLHNNSIKILVDGNIKIWGKSETGEIIHLKLIKSVKVNEEKNFLFI